MKKAAINPIKPVAYPLNELRRAAQDYLRDFVKNPAPQVWRFGNGSTICISGG